MASPATDVVEGDDYTTRLRRQPVMMGKETCWFRGDPYEKDVRTRQEHYAIYPRVRKIGWIQPFEKSQYKICCSDNSSRDYSASPASSLPAVAPPPPTLLSRSVPTPRLTALSWGTFERAQRAGAAAHGDGTRVRGGGGGG